MAETVEAAKTGRAKCRSCREPIEKGSLRFGEEQPSAFAEGLQWVWYHLTCAAKKRPTKVREALAAFEGEVPDRAELDRLLAEADETATTTPYAERAPTGRSKCQHCEQPIEKGTLRVAFERELEVGGMARAGVGFLHSSCAAKYLDQEMDLLATLRKNSRGLSDSDVAELEQQTASQG
jgi:poly [ADP-ribose] polymerase